MLNKVFLYMSVLHRGELLKRIEYKFKDLIGYFHLRHSLSLNNKNSTCVIPNLDFSSENKKIDNKFYTFNRSISYENLMDELNETKKFWRNYKLSNNIKEIWEINRLQFLLPISLNNKQLAIDLLDDWIIKNQYEYSINWINNLEVSIRAINIFLFLVICNDKKINDKYNNLLYMHGNYIYNEIKYSKVCIPNNHLIGEATALLILGKSFSNKKWIKRAVNIYRKYSNIISEVGISKECSFSYQWFVTKMFILILPYLDDSSFYDELMSKVKNSLYVLNMGVLDEDVYLNYGDNDGGYLFSFDNRYLLGKDIKRYYNLFFNDIVDNETLLIKNMYKYYNKTISYDKIEYSNYFYDKNIFIFRKDNNLLFFNAKDIKEHAHNDSLSINIFINGKEVIYDSGTYCYDSDKRKREYYVSRNAHSTLLFNIENAKHISTFRWKNYYKSYIEYVNVKENLIEVSGIIENICRRKIVIDIDTNNICVYDESLNNSNISSNWILDDGKIEDNKIINDYVDISFDNGTIKNKEVSISKKFLEEGKSSCYTTDGYLRNNIKIVVRSR